MLEELAGVELGGLEPATSSFCDAVALAPVRWITDAAIPLQVWIDAFAELSEVPAGADDAVRRLRGFAADRMAWQLGQRDERPSWEDQQISDAVALADAALEHCADLPLVVGLLGTSDTPLAWQDLDAAAVEDKCADDRQRVERAVAEYVTAFGRQPRHQIEMEPVLPSFYASDWHGVTVDDDGVAQVVPVPSGACDPG